MANQLDRAVVAAAIRKRSKDRELRRILLLAVKSQELQHVKFTTSGLMLFTSKGSAQTHWTPSDNRSTKNLLAALRRIGLLPR